ncbi:MAG: hypothetical protein CMO44_15365, partial [Verrucomicrobiales bacterium]|nr:hypothetical protein [Verrucomicrobiales bacterium]
YYTPNLTSKNAILLNNDAQNNFEIINMEGTFQTIDEIIIEKRKKKDSPALKNTRALGHELKSEEK